MAKRTETKAEVICLKDNKIQCFNDRKIERLRESLADSANLDCVAQRLKVLGHKVRLQIIELLANEECCVCDLANVLQQPVSTLSQHLKNLKSVGLVQSRQSGKFVIYSLVGSEIAATVGIIEILGIAKEKAQ